MPIQERNDQSPTDPEWRWNGQKTTGEKSPESGLRARRSAFKTVEEFAAWRRSKGMPFLSEAQLLEAWARFRGEPVYETAALNPLTEKRFVGAGDAGVHVARKF